MKHFKCPLLIVSLTNILYFKVGFELSVLLFVYEGYRIDNGEVFQSHEILIFD